MINYTNEIDRITMFIADYCQSTGYNKLVIGLSGGIDSALSAALAVRALGSENVFGINIPYKLSHPDSANDALLVAECLNISFKTIDLSPMTDSYFDTYAVKADKLRRGNWMARIRMNVIYDYAAERNALVVGTGNRTELMVGYCTQYGDSACAFEPIGHLYKTEVWEMARVLQLPDRVINKTPTADLWEGQSDEAELGMRYADLDAILMFLTEGIITQIYTKAQIEKVRKLIKRSEFKRIMPPIPERTIC
jgi:NAD+ synthase